MKNTIFKFLQSINSKIGAGTKFLLVSIFFIFLSFMLVMSRAENIKQRNQSELELSKKAEVIPFLPQQRLLHINKN